MSDDRVSAWFDQFDPGEQDEIVQAMRAVPTWLVNSIAEADLTIAEVVEYVPRHPHGRT